MSTKTVKNIREPLKKPRPLRSVSVEQPKDTSNTKARPDILTELEYLHNRISNCDFDEVVKNDICTMCILLKKDGEEMEPAHKDALDRYFSTIRNICREDRLDAISRLQLLEVIELRASHWRLNENMSNYFNMKYRELEESNERYNVSGSLSPNAIMNMQNQNFANANNISLASGEFLRSSGKFSKPTKIAGKNYFKDEIVIRNCDSGKVNAGARDRLVQITGPHEDAISHAKFLVEDTIKRNVSPVRDNLNPSELNFDNKNHVDYGNTFFDRNSQIQPKRSLSHSYSMSDASTKEFSLEMNIGHDIITLSGAKPELLKTANLVLTEYFKNHLDTLDKETNVLTKSNSMSNTTRFALKKQASLKDNLSSTFSSLDHGFSRQSSSMSSSSEDILPNEESSDVEAISPPIPAPIPAPTYVSAGIILDAPTRRPYNREFLLECSRLPLSQKQPPNYKEIASNFPDLMPQYKRSV